MLHVHALQPRRAPPSGAARRRCSARSSRRSTTCTSTCGLMREIRAALGGGDVPRAAGRGGAGPGRERAAAYRAGRRAGQGGAAGRSTTSASSLLLVGIFYFLLLRPEQKRRREHEHAARQLKRNDQVVLSSGIHGRVIVDRRQGDHRGDRAEGAGAGRPQRDPDGRRRRRAPRRGRRNGEVVNRTLLVPRRCSSSWRPRSSCCWCRRSCGRCRLVALEAAHPPRASTCRAAPTSSQRRRRPGDRQHDRPRTRRTSSASCATAQVGATTVDRHGPHHQHPLANTDKRDEARRAASKERFTTSRSRTPAPRREAAVTLAFELAPAEVQRIRDSVARAGAGDHPQPHRPVRRRRADACRRRATDRDRRAAARHPGPAARQGAHRPDGAARVQAPRRGPAGRDGREARRRRRRCCPGRARRRAGSQYLVEQPHAHDGRRHHRRARRARQRPRRAWRSSSSLDARGAKQFGDAHQRATSGGNLAIVLDGVRRVGAEHPRADHGRPRADHRPVRLRRGAGPRQRAAQRRAAGAAEAAGGADGRPVARARTRSARAAVVPRRQPRRSSPS